MADSDSWDADNFEPDEPAKKPVALLDKWEGEDEDEDVKDNWDDEEEEAEQKPEEKPSELKTSDKKKINEKIKEKENKQKKQQEELRKRLKESLQTEQTPEEEAAERLRQKKAQEEADLELAREAFGVESAPGETTERNSVFGIDGLQPSSREDFATFEKLLREKITQYEKSIHYSTFLESLFRELCISLEVEDLKKINTSLTVLLNEKQKQEKQQAKGKKKKKTNLAGGGLKAKMKDDLDDYAGFGGGYEQDYEDFM